MEVFNIKTTLGKKSPSLLRLIIDEIDELDPEKMEELLWKIKMEKALALAKMADITFKDKFLSLGGEQIASLVSETRKAAYDAKIHH